MSSLPYDDNKLRYAGDFRISEVALFNAYGNVAGIGSAVVEISIFEDLNSNFLTGNLTFIDTEDLINKLPIIGQEFLEFKIRTPLDSKYDEGEYDFTNTRMAVYKVTRQRLNQNTQSITLDFISTEGIRDQNVKISRAFNGPYDDAVAKIFKKSWGLNSKKKLYIQPTQNNFKFVAPNMRPSDLMNMMASRAVSYTSTGEGGQVSYLFYENGQGFHFRSMDSFFFLVKSEGVAPHPEMFEYFCDSESTRGFANPQENPISQLRVVKSHTLVGTNDLIKNQRMGTFASKLITHDAYNKTYNEYKYNYIDEYNGISHLEKDEALGDNSSALYRGLIVKAHYDFNDLETSNRTRGSAYKYLSDYADARIMVQSNTAKIHNTNSDQGFRVNEYLQKRKSALNLFNTIEMELEVNGNTHLNIGHVIRINVPRTGPGKDDTKTSQNDKYLTGRWLITAIRHSFDCATKVHNMILTCSKETYGTNLQEKVSPLVLDVTDEGNPINLYNNTEYN